MFLGGTSLRWALLATVWLCPSLDLQRREPGPGSQAHQLRLMGTSTPTWPGALSYLRRKPPSLVCCPLSSGLWAPRGCKPASVSALGHYSGPSSCQSPAHMWCGGCGAFLLNSHPRGRTPSAGEARVWQGQPTTPGLRTQTQDDTRTQDTQDTEQPHLSCQGTASSRVQGLSCTDVPPNTSRMAAATGQRPNVPRQQGTLRLLLSSSIKMLNFLKAEEKAKVVRGHEATEQQPLCPSPGLAGSTRWLTWGRRPAK